jgi:hypothetical protein
MKWVNRDFSHWGDSDPHTMSSLRRIQNYIGTVKPPKYPLPIDATLAAAGATLFQAQCGSCHAPGGSRTGHAHRRHRDRHRSTSPRDVDGAVGRRLQRVRRRLRLEVLALPDHQRVHVGAARRAVDASALPSQRIGTDAGRPARTGGAASAVVLAGL